MTAAAIVGRSCGLALALATLSAGVAWAGPPVAYPHAHYHQHYHAPGGRIVADGPGAGWGFPNGNPDGYGWWDHDAALPLGGNRLPEYYFPRYYAVPAPQAFLQSYYNPYLTRGQRYVAYVGGGGAHPAGGPPTGSAMTPVHPYQDTIGSGPRVRIPAFNGRIEAPPINSGGSGLTP
jgi:hypothetical protein